MSILAQQNINNFDPQAEEGSGGRLERRWVRSLGRAPRGEGDSAEAGSSNHAGNGFGGFAYSPEGLARIILGVKWKTGPQGKTINSSFAESQYGPRDFNILGPDDHDGIGSGWYAGGEYESGTDGPRYSSILSSFAFMIGKGGQWGTSNIAQNMKQTFTSGEQMKSLWNAEAGVNGTPIASGGQFEGYQASRPYKLSTYAHGFTLADFFQLAERFEELTKKQQTELQDMASSGKLARPTWEKEISMPAANVNTGIRNIPEMG
jgi:hypothetical protein